MFLHETRYGAGDEFREACELIGSRCDYRVYADRPVPAGEPIGDASVKKDFKITMRVVDLISLCLKPHATTEDNYHDYQLKVATKNGSVSVVGSTKSKAMRDAYQKCLIQAKAEIAGIVDINDVGVIHASDSEPRRGDGLMDSTAKNVDMRLKGVLSSKCVIRVDHADRVIFIRGSVFYKEDYEIVSGLKQALPDQEAHIKSVDISGLLNAGFDKPVSK